MIVASFLRRLQVAAKVPFGDPEPGKGCIFSGEVTPMET